MPFEIIMFVLLGIIFGFLAGLIPGIHPNTIFMLTLSMMFVFSGFSSHAMIAFVVSLAVSNTFFDFIPTILFGAPEEDSVLSILPGHKLLMEGRGYEALFLTVAGGLGVILLTVASLPALILFIPLIYSTIRPAIHLILMLVVFWMIWSDSKRFKAIVIFSLAGIFGLLVLNSFPSDTIMFPSLTGLFGMSTILVSIVTRVKIPPQKIEEEIDADWIRGSIAGWLAGLLAGLLPGIGSSQAGIIAAQALKAKLREFIIALGGINTSNIFFTFIVFYVIGKTRSGAVWMVSQIVESFTVVDMSLLVVVGVMTALISVVMTLKVGKIFIRKMKNINYTRTMAATFAALLLLVVVLSGPIGVLVSLSGMFIGLLAISFGVKRTHLMGFLLLPTIIYFSGLTPFTLNILW